jgi:outer membrane lipoprotein carrier protein
MQALSALLHHVRATAAVLVLCAVSPAHASSLDRLKSFVEQTKGARALFSQTVTAKSGRKPQQASGTMVFSRPGRFRWTYDKPYYQLIVGDGKKLWVYDKDLNQVTVKTLGTALGSSPAALLAGDNALDKDFELKDGGSKDGIEWVDAEPKAADSSFESMRIGFSGDALKLMELRDNFGNTTTLTFTAFERNPQLDPGLFRFSPPKGADVVGE